MCPTPLWLNPSQALCCLYGQVCGNNGNCLYVSSSSTSSGTRPTGGNPSGGPGPNPNPTTDPSDIPSITPYDPGLSVGARAGIGAGVAIGASIIIGLVTWLCVRQRRRAASSRGRGSVVTYTYGGEGSGTHSGRGRGLGLGLGLGSGFSSAGRGDTFPHSTAPGSGGMGSGAMSETTDGAGPLRGMTSDYFGPDAVSGPLTDTGPGSGAARGSANTSPGIGVPIAPLHPDHIVAPVEIDSKETPVKEAASRPGGDGSRRVSYYGNTGVHESIEGRFELYSESPPVWEADMGTPALYQGQEKEEAQQQQQDAAQDDNGTTEAAPFLPREAAASPRSLSPRDMASPRSVSPVGSADLPSGHSNVSPAPGQGGDGAPHTTS